MRRLGIPLADAGGGLVALVYRCAPGRWYGRIVWPLGHFGRPWGTSTNPRWL